MGIRITCVGESYHSTDPWDEKNPGRPINLEHGESDEVSDEKAARCAELVGLVEVDAGGPAPDRPIHGDLKVSDYEAANAEQVATMVGAADLDMARAVLAYEEGRSRTRKTVTDAATARITELAGGQ